MVLDLDLPNLQIICFVFNRIAVEVVLLRLHQIAHGFSQIETSRRSENIDIFVGILSTTTALRY